VVEGAMLLLACLLCLVSIGSSYSDSILLYLLLASRGIAGISSLSTKSSVVSFSISHNSVLLGS
jgi:hypothetical protein